MAVKRFCFPIVFLSLLALSLNGCSRSPCAKYLTHDYYLKPIQLVKVPKPYSLIQRRKYDLCVLERHGVQVIRLGQTWTLVFPSDDLFENETAEINDHYKPLLNVAADFLQTYPKISVEVTSFTNKVPEEKEIITKFGTVTDELMSRQSDTVAKYLEKHGANARLIYAVDKGNSDDIAWNGSKAGRHLNRRVEVSFRYYRDNTAWY